MFVLQFLTQRSPFVRPGVRVELPESSREQNTKPTGCPVYDWDDDVDGPVHLLATGHKASQRVAAHCGAMPGKRGWVILGGDVPDDRWCTICVGQPTPRLPDDLTEAQLDGRACVRCGAEHEPTRPVEAWSELSSQLFECGDSEVCAGRVAGR